MHCKQCIYYDNAFTMFNHSVSSSYGSITWKPVWAAIASVDLTTDGDDTPTGSMTGQEYIY